MQGFSPNRRLWIEFALLMVAAPLAMDAMLSVKYLLPAIWLAALYCWLVVRLLAGKGARLGWNSAAITRAACVPILRRFAVSALLMGGLTWALAPELLFGFVREKPLLWAAVMLLYPILSVIPQEFIFRRFFFMRYATLFPKPATMLIMSAVMFGFAHLLFHNWVAPFLCVVGGWMFAQTYDTRRSLALVVLEHALYGDFLFTLGLGRYFYHGTVAATL